MDKKTIKNYIYNTSYQVLVLITPLITAPYTSRILRPEGIGIYSYTTSIATFFSFFAALGINMYGQREIAYTRENAYQRSKVFWELVITRVTMTIVTSLVYIVFCFFYKEYTYYLLLQAFLIFSVMFDISWYFQGTENFKLIALRNVAIKIVSVVLIFALVKKPSDLYIYILITSLSTLFGYFVLLINLRGEIVFVKKSEINIRRHIRGNIEFFIPVLAVQIYSQVDKIMLGAIINDDAQNGYYEQSRKIINIVLMVVTSINTVMYPRIANLFAEGKIDGVRRTLQKNYRFLIMMILPIVVGLYLITDNFVLWFFGNGYEPVIVLIKLSCILLFFMSIGNFCGMQFLNPIGRQNIGTKIYIMSALINIVLNSILIPKYLTIGAIISSIIAEVFACISQLVILEKSEYRINLATGIWKYCISVGVMMLWILIFQRLNLFSGIEQTIVEIISSAIIYATLLLLLKEENALMARKIIIKND